MNPYESVYEYYEPRQQQKFIFLQAFLLLEIRFAFFNFGHVFDDTKDKRH
jgi:hypothetical protein